MKQLKTDPAFTNLIPPISDDELHSLEENILALGRCRDAIKLWRGTIIDGHNRYTICQKHNIPFKTVQLRFSSKKDVELWIIQNQLGRRNLTNAMRIKLALHKEALLREKAKQNRSGIQDIPVHVRKAIAKEAGVSEQTVYKYMKIRELGTPEQLQQVDSGQVKIGTAHRGLQVTVKTIECLYEAEDTTPDIRNPFCEAAVHCNIDRLVGIFGFIGRNFELIKSGEDFVEVVGRLKGMCHRVFGVVDGG